VGGWGIVAVIDSCFGLGERKHNNICGRTFDSTPRHSTTILENVSKHAHVTHATVHEIKAKQAPIRWGQKGAMKQ
jgi:hypothetical protein